MRKLESMSWLTNSMLGRYAGDTTRGLVSLVSITIMLATPGPTTAIDEASIAPHSSLVDLADNEAIDLGPYACESRAPSMRCKTIFDFSRINYDPYNHRFVIFGGGHAATGRTDIDAFDMTTLTWGSLYPTMSCEDIRQGDIDPRGFHRTSHHPVARHSYDQNVVAEVEGHGKLLMFSTEGFSGACHPYKATIQAPAAFTLTDPDAGWRFGSRSGTPWGYAGTAEFDPVSGFVVLLSGNATKLWVYDPTIEKVIFSMKGLIPAKNSSNLLYNPRDRNMYLVDRSTLQVRRFVLNRNDWGKTVVTMVATTGNPPSKLRNLSYDSRNHVIGGVSGGSFHSLDMKSFEWHSQPINIKSDPGAEIGTVRGHAIDYDPVNNIFVFVSGKLSKLRTWAYRFRK